MFDLLSTRRQSTEQFHDGAGNGCTVRVLNEWGSEGFVQPAQLQAAGYDEDSGAFLHDLFSDRVPVVHFTKNFLDQILHRDETRNTAVFVDNQNELLSLHLHFLQKVIDGFRLRDKMYGNYQRSKRLELFTTLPDTEQITFMDDAFDIVQVIAKHRNPGVSTRGDQLHQLFHRRIDFQRNDMGSGRHHFPGNLVSELHDRLNHLARVLLENSLFLPGVDECLNFLLRRFFLFIWFHDFFPAIEVVQYRR